MHYKLFREAVRKKGLNGKDLALKMKLVPETVSRHMNGRTTPSFSQIKKYANILDISPSLLLFGETSNNTVEIEKKVSEVYDKIKVELSVAEKMYKDKLITDEERQKMRNKILGID